MKCRESAGFIIPRPCPNEATVKCSACGKDVCGDHTAALPHGGIACTSCAAAQNVGPGVQRHQLLGYYGYRPGLYGYGYGPVFYSDSDYSAFSRRSSVGEPGDELIDGS